MCTFANKRAYRHVVGTYMYVRARHTLGGWFWEHASCLRLCGTVAYLVHAWLRQMLVEMLVAWGKSMCVHVDVKLMARVLVYCAGNDSSYDNQMWYEKVKDIVQLNRCPIAASDTQPPPVLRQRDSVFVHYHGRGKGKATLYKGTINFPVDVKKNDGLSWEGSSHLSSSYSTTGHTSTGADIQPSSVEQSTVRPSASLTDTGPTHVSSPLRQATGCKRSSESGGLCNPAKKAWKAGE